MATKNEGWMDEGFSPYAGTIKTKPDRGFYYCIIIFGLLLLLPTLFFWWMYIMTITVSEGAYEAMQQMDDFSATKLEYTLDFVPLILMPTLFSILLLNLGYVGLRNKKGGLLSKLPKYEVGLMAVLILVQLGLRFIGK